MPNPLNVRAGGALDPMPDKGAPDVLMIPRAILGLVDVAADEKTRYAMDGVRLTRAADGRMRAVATQGKSLAIVEWREPTELDASERGAGEGSVVLPRAAIEAARKTSAPRRGESPRAACARWQTPAPGAPAGAPTLTAHGKTGPTTTEARPLDGHYPPVEDAAPGAEPIASSREAPRTVVAVNASLLLDLARALTIAATGDPKADPLVYLSVPVDNPTLPIYVRPVRDLQHAEPPLTRACGVLMPVGASAGEAARCTF